MEYKNEKLSARFVVPDKITVRQQLAYLSETVKNNDGTSMQSLWNGARLLIQDWVCPVFPIFDTKLDDVTDPQITELILWAAMEVRKHINNLESIPKN